MFVQTDLYLLIAQQPCSTVEPELYDQVNARDVRNVA